LLSHFCFLIWIFPAPAKGESKRQKARLRQGFGGQAKIKKEK
jgi:truncated hemoglobin YjbI